MSKVITSPVPEFPGTVTLCTMPTLELVENFLDARWLPRTSDETKRTRNRVLLECIIAWVEVWNIENQPSPITVETMNPLPYEAARELIQWLISEIDILIAREKKIPNALSPESTSTQKTPAEIENQPK